MLPVPVWTSTAGAGAAGAGVAGAGAAGAGAAMNWPCRCHYGLALPLALPQCAGAVGAKSCRVPEHGKAPNPAGQQTWEGAYPGQTPAMGRRPTRPDSRHGKVENLAGHIISTVFDLSPGRMSMLFIVLYKTNVLTLLL